jgi:hypothetical protein
VSGVIVLEWKYMSQNIQEEQTKVSGVIVLEWKYMSQNIQGGSGRKLASESLPMTVNMIDKRLRDALDFRKPLTGHLAFELSQKRIANDHDWHVMTIRVAILKHPMP